MTITQKFPAQLGIQFERQSASYVLSHMFSVSLIVRFILFCLSASGIVCAVCACVYTDMHVHLYTFEASGGHWVPLWLWTFCHEADGFSH